MKQPKCVSCDINVTLQNCANDACHRLLCQHAAEDNGRCAVCSPKGKVGMGG